MQFLFVGSNVCLRLPSDSSSRRTPLPLTNTPYCKVYSGLAPYSCYDMPGAQTKASDFIRGFTNYQRFSTTKAFVLLGLTNSVFHRSVRCSAFCPSLTFTIEQQNKILSLVTTFSCRRWGNVYKISHRTCLRQAGAKFSMFKKNRYEKILLSGIYNPNAFGLLPID